MRPSLATFWLFLGYLKPLSLGAPSLLVRGKRRASGVRNTGVETKAPHYPG